MAKAVEETSGQLEDAPQKVDVDLGTALERIDSWVDGAVRLLPNIVVALGVVAIFIGLGLLAKKLIEKKTGRNGRENLGEVLGGFVKWFIIIGGLMFATTILIPSVTPGDLFAGLGVSSVAIGFAFKDILQNWLSGLLILLRQPFEINDQILVDGHEGTVEHIETRATIIKTYDGEKIVIPNSDIYTNAVRVKTAYETRRSQYDIGIGYGDDIEKAIDIIYEAISNVKDVNIEPKPQVLPWALEASWVTLRARWWTDTRRADIVFVHSEVIKAVKLALDKNGIDMPFETLDQLVHDQTEHTDGDRLKQREGWPNISESGTNPRWKAALEVKKSETTAV